MRVDAILAVVLLGGVSMAVEHPGVVPEDVECASCHAAKITGKSVHSVMATSCGVCHLTQTRGDMSIVSLSMPKQKICSACHDEPAVLRVRRLRRDNAWSVMMRTVAIRRCCYGWRQHRGKSN